VFPEAGLVLRGGRLCLQGRRLYLSDRSRILCGSATSERGVLGRGRTSWLGLRVAGIGGKSKIIIMKKSQQLREQSKPLTNESSIEILVIIYTYSLAQAHSVSHFFVLKVLISDSKCAVALFTTKALKNYGAQRTTFSCLSTKAVCFTKYPT